MNKFLRDWSSDDQGSWRSYHIAIRSLDKILVAYVAQTSESGYDNEFFWHIYTDMGRPIPRRKTGSAGSIERARLDCTEELLASGYVILSDKRINML